VISRGLKEFRGKRVLMLQGPVGPFFSRLATDLAWAGALVYKVNFNGGDWVFSLFRQYAGVVNYRGRMADWPDFYADLLIRLNIDIVLLFGDCRPIHAQVVHIAHAQNLEVGVFEEGYLRPDYITLERDGVNNHSSLSTDPSYYLNSPFEAAPPTRPVGSTFGMAALWGMVHNAAGSVFKPWFWHYRHHRSLSWLDGLHWIRSYIRKKHYAVTEKHIMPLLTGAHSGKFFLVALQTNADAQIKIHSAFESVGQFIEETIASFGQHAPANMHLVIKHHPLDRGYTDYTALVARCVAEHRIGYRCHYIHDQHLPTLFKHARGVVVVNSTVGLSAVGEGVPVKVCGEAIYHMRGLTFQGSLDAFWRQAREAVPHPALFKAFKNYLVARTQHNGSFYKRLPDVAHDTGVAWTDRDERAQRNLLNFVPEKRKRHRAA
jgi:capsular polysaccharide export protein